ncbi:Mov34/MPN/PAD-1 family protein [Anaerocolumna xylanovorans]|uniref:Proteasome lid subunit RPN8/RPN11, contains Jab1/MPN metalloenzyme (JAMM) motif n=1 Tax=Anaerocolumna xylanovorans DSM 12503 TaxID=1121345 RepID=A0A1M7YLU1_9FIRM|nr:Mov34/MPN/PAD-1 family protein [Anaerocolumna xylanovorans]SHO53559.1 Proteasome lid subunit RPN8/RPN11, contains Jab1/MPN metalloenzyme (JAMM) motif [Anaerocolumna xylanovorans DSM 12503]
MKKEIFIPTELINSFTKQVIDKFPQKAFGYFISSIEGGNPDEFIMFSNDQRNEWKDMFEEYGNYYVRNNDAGFLANEEEVYEINKLIKNKGKHIVGVFHSHQRHPAIFSTVDIDLHPSPKLWHLIISLRNIESPQIKAFEIQENVPNELEIVRVNQQYV